MEAIAAGDELAVDVIDIAVVSDTNGGAVCFEVMQRNLAAFETQISTIAQPPGNEVLHDFLLTINGHGSYR